MDVVRGVKLPCVLLQAIKMDGAVSIASFLVPNVLLLEDHLFLGQTGQPCQGNLLHLVHLWDRWVDSGKSVGQQSKVWNYSMEVKKNVTNSAMATPV